jgi:hypothetical protein
MVTRCPTLGCEGALVAPASVRRAAGELLAATANALTLAVMLVAAVGAVGWLVMSMALGILETFRI